MEQVELHAPGHLRERRNPLPKHTQTGHARQRIHRTRATQQRHELFAHRFAHLRVGRDFIQHFSQAACGQRMQAAHIRGARPTGEQGKDAAYIAMRP
ncbi:hypothetical protein D3C81_969030 [compost metagenome]